MAIINDSDLLVVQKGGNNYTYSGAQLKDDMREFGSGGTAPTPSLAQVCAVGSSTGRAITVNGDLNVIDGGVATGIGDFGISTQGSIGCDKNLSGNELGVTTTATVGGLINALGGIQAGSNITVVGEYTFNSVHAYGATAGGTRRDASINAGGWLTAGDNGFFRSTATNIQPVDTSNFITALKSVNLHVSDQPVPESSRQLQIDPNLTSQTEVGLFVDDIESSAASSFLLDGDEGDRFFTNRRYAHFLFGVCKEQQQLIENLTTRIEQLEADHASAMNNMENDNGSSTY